MADVCPRPSSWAGVLAAWSTTTGGAGASVTGAGTVVVGTVVVGTVVVGTVVVGTVVVVADALVVDETAAVGSLMASVLEGASIAVPATESGCAPHAELASANSMAVMAAAVRLGRIGDGRKGFTVIPPGSDVGTDNIPRM
jgi:hypothetical protein